MPNITGIKYVFFVWNHFGRTPLKKVENLSSFCFEQQTDTMRIQEANKLAVGIFEGSLMKLLYS